MSFLRRLPVYAAGAGLTAAVVAVAAARHWSGVETLLVGLGVGVFYVVTILVPWLIREQIGRVTIARGPDKSWRIKNGNGHAVSFRVEHGVLIGNGDEGSFPIPTTSGPAVVEHREPQVAAR